MNLLVVMFCDMDDFCKGCVPLPTRFRGARLANDAKSLAAYNH
jgi:hypothetical protein